MTIEAIYQFLINFGKDLALFGVLAGYAINFFIKPLQDKNKKTCSEALEKQRQTEERFTKLEKGVFALLQSMLYSRCMRIKERGKGALQEKQILTALYETYRELKGNGVICQLYHEAMETETT